MALNLVSVRLDFVNSVVIRVLKDKTMCHNVSTNICLLQMETIELGEGVKQVAIFHQFTVLLNT